mgnify:FL=1
MMLETERLILRPVQIEDAEDMYAYASDPLVTEMVTFDTYTSMQDAYDSINTFFLNRDPNTHFEALAIVDKESLRMIGTVDAGKVVRGDMVELGYILHRDFWNRGIMTEAARRYIQYLFDDKGIRRIEVSHHPKNMASKRVIEKLGFVFEGVRRQYVKFGDSYADVPYYSLLKGELR